MAPLKSENVYRDLSLHYSSMHQHTCARFYAERLFYERQSPANLYVLAECFVREGKIKQAYMALQGSKSSQNRYLLAHCCVQLSLFGEGEEALIATGQERDTSAFNQVPGGSCGIYLLGMIYKHQHRKEQAISCFKKCLKMDPTHWASAIELSGMGEQIDPGKLFGVPLLTAKEILEGCKIKEGDFRRSTTLPNGKKIPE